MLPVIRLEIVTFLQQQDLLAVTIRQLIYK